MTLISQNHYRGRPHITDGEKDGRASPICTSPHGDASASPAGCASPTIGCIPINDGASEDPEELGQLQ